MSETSSKLSEVVAQANQLKAAIREEEDIVAKVLTTLPGERALIDIPAAMQWKYEYSKPNAKVRETRYGVATARHVLLTVNGLIGRTTLTVMAGPSRDFMSKNVGRLHVLLERVGGLDSLLRLIGNEIERQLQMMDKSQGGKGSAQAEVLLQRVETHK